MRVSSTLFVLFPQVILFAFAQSAVPPTDIAPTTTVSSTETRSSTGRSTSRTGSGSLTGTGTASTQSGTGTATTTSAIAYPTLGGVDPCVVQCMQTGVAQANCVTITDVACYCSNAQFLNTVVQCVASTCPGQLSNAETLGQQFCNIASVTLSYPAPTSTAPPSTSATAPASSTLPSPSPNAGSRSFGVRDTTLWVVVAAVMGFMGLRDL